MKDPDLAIIARLLADPAISKLVGTRVYRVNLPPNPQWPSITVQGISDIEDGDTNTSKYAHTRVQCTAWAKNDVGASGLSKLIRASLHGLTNTTLPCGDDWVYFENCKDAGARPDANPAIPVYMWIRDFRIEYKAD